MQNSNDVTPNFSEVPQAAPSDAPPKRMLEVERDGSQTLVRINSSSLSVIQACPRKAKYVLHEKWQAKAKSPALVFGSAIHKALEVFYAWPKAVREIPENFVAHADLMAHGHAEPEKHFLYDAIAAFVRAAEPLRALPDTDKRSIASGVWLLGHYFKTYIADAYTTYIDADGPVTERQFCVPLIEKSNLKIELHGQIDVILRNEATGELLCADHKTTSIIGNDFFARLKPNSQYCGYIYAASKLFGLTNGNFLVNGLETKAKPLTDRGGPPKFVRQITTRTDADIEEFKDVISWAVESYLNWETKNIWPLGDVNSCSMYGGCPYLDVCSAPNILRQNILEAKFECKVINA